MKYKNKMKMKMILKRLI